MKVLIQNYSDLYSTQTFYLNQCLGMVDSIETKLWQMERESTHDCFDRFKPDLFIANGKVIDDVLLKYLSDNKNIKVIVNISRCNQHIVDYLEDKILSLGIDCTLFFSEGYDFLVQSRSKKIKFFCVKPAMDLFLNPPKSSYFSLENCIISNEYSQEYENVCSSKKHYHKILFGIDLDSNFDVESNVSNLSSFVDNYREVILAGSADFICSQVFFDCMSKAEKVSIKPNADEEDNFLKILSELFSENGKDTSLDEIKEQIKINHTCIHRVHKIMLEAGFINEANAVASKFGEKNEQPV